MFREVAVVVLLREVTDAALLRVVVVSGLVREDAASILFRDDAVPALLRSRVYVRVLGFVAGCTGASIFVRLFCAPRAVG